tara:strand:+ start:2794 stop:2988 length:195 start_codon:yes stop_codon:yes gene_type:complete
MKAEKVLTRRRKHVPKSRSIDVGIKDKKKDETEQGPVNNWDEGIETFVNVRIKRPVIRIDREEY